MKAVTVVPGTRDSALLDDVSEPDPTLGTVLVECLAVGLNGVGGVAATPSDRFTGLATEMVLKNLVVFGTVNANRRHY